MKHLFNLNNRLEVFKCLSKRTKIYNSIQDTIFFLQLKFFYTFK